MEYGMGDQMASFIVEEEFEKEIFDTMSPTALKFFDKNFKPLIEPSHGILHGYIQCSKVDFTLTEKKSPRNVETLAELKELYEKEELELQELVYLDGHPTTYGRATIESITKRSIDKILEAKDPLTGINGNNISDFMRWVSCQKNAAQITKDIRIFVQEMGTLEGFSALSMHQVNTNVPKELSDEYDKLANDSSLDGVQKFVAMNDVINRMKASISDNMDKELKETIESSNRMKISSIAEMTLPSINMTDDKEILINRSSLYKSMNEEEYRSHSLQNREMLKLKHSLVPRSGFMNRQFTYLGQNLEFNRTETDPTNMGIWLPKDRAEGRTTVEGKVLKKSSSKDLVKVRSIAVSYKPFVTRDMISQVHFPPDEIPISWGFRLTSVTEEFTQKGLQLKHTGSFVQVPMSNKLNSLAKVTGKIVKDVEKKRILIVDEADNEKIIEAYPLPDSFDTDVNGRISGDSNHIGTALQIRSTGLNLDIIIKITKAQKGSHDLGLAKNEVTLGPSFAPVSGVIKYNFEEGTFKIGNDDMGAIVADSVYYYPDGARVKLGDRISSYPIDTGWYLSRGYNLTDTYTLFRNQFLELVSMTEELLETLFHLMISKNEATGQSEYLGTLRAFREDNDSLFTRMAFRESKNTLAKASASGFTFKNDMMTRNILTHLIMSSKKSSAETRLLSEPKKKK